MRQTDYSMRCDPWTVAKVSIKGMFFYELWHDKQPAMVGRYSSFDLAKHAVEEMEAAGQG